MGMEWEWIALGVDAGLALLFYKLYREKSKAADLVQGAKDFAIGQTLEKGAEVPYACVQGVVQPLGAAVKSQHTSEEGVIRHTQFIEHKSRKDAGFWHDTTHMIRNNYKTVPFCLAAPEDGSLSMGNPPCIRVDDPLSADFLQDDLTITHDHFEPKQAGLLERGLDRIFGDVSKGFQEKERLLPVGAYILGFGKLRNSSSMLLLEPPTEDQLYILTTSTKRQVINSLLGTAKFFRVVTWILGIAGVGIVGYIVYKQYKKWLAGRDTREMHDAVLRARARNRDEGGEGDSPRECVVCLTNPREVVLLDCAHICLCMDCSMALPEPRKCPVCRAEVVRVSSIFLP